jgi:hypothetical protein
VISDEFVSLFKICFCKSGNYFAEIKIYHPKNVSHFYFDQIVKIYHQKIKIKNKMGLQDRAGLTRLHMTHNMACMGRQN